MKTAEDLSTAYGETRARIVELVTAPGVDVEQRVPATPEWRVKDVVAHLAGVCDDIVSGNLEGVTTDPWTAKQVERRKDVPLAALIDEWANLAREVEPIIPMFPGHAGAQFVSDVVTHEHDIRGALGRPGARDSAAARVGVEFMVGSWIHYAVKSSGVPSLLVDSGEKQWRVGDGDPVATLRAEPFELMRAASGRRSLAQIRKFGWSGDPEPYLATFEWGPFRPANADVVE